MTIVDEAEDEDHLYSYMPFKQKMRQKECIVDKASGEDFIFSTTKGVLSWNHLKNACSMLNNFPCVKVMCVKSSKFAQSYCLIVLTLAYCEEKNWMQIKVDEQSPHLPHSLAKQWLSAFSPLCGIAFPRIVSGTNERGTLGWPMGWLGWGGPLHLDRQAARGRRWTSRGIEMWRNVLSSCLIIFLYC